MTIATRAAGNPPMKLAALVFFLAFLPAAALAAPNAAPTLPENARLAVAGDSITERKLYTKFMEAYIVACSGRTDVSVFQFGWSGQTAGGFADRAANDLAAFQPSTVTLCFGMNDGGYQPFNESIGKRFEDSMKRGLIVLRDNGIKHIVVGSPGAVDTFYFNRTGGGDYNHNLAQLGKIGKKLAGEIQQSFADVHQPMIDAMLKAEPVLGKEYDVCGTDGYHPNENGHLVMAYAFLKGLGFDGDIGTITVDMNGNAKATEGHKVVSSAPGSAELESVRYPFCFQGNEKSPSGTLSIVPFIPFNAELNRYTLKVANLNAAKARVEWGTQLNEFTKEQLAAGVNLAAEFAARTPFEGVFLEYLNRVAAKQEFETYYIKEVINKFRMLSPSAKADPDVAAVLPALDNLRAKLAARHKALDDKAREVLQPVKHIITVTPL